jgi:hypothetical protein
MELTEQLCNIVDQWLKWKGYKDIFDYGNKVVAPSDGETGQMVLDPESGVAYGEDYLYENVACGNLMNFTLTKENLLEFYFNTGDDGSQHQMRVDIGYDVVNAILEGKKYKLPIAQTILENVGYIPMSYCEEVVDGHPLEDYENIDLDWNVEIILKE